MRRFTILLLFLATSSAAAKAPPPGTILMGADLLGRSLTASFDTEWFVSSRWSLGAAIGYVPPIWTGDSAALPHVHLGYMPSAESTWYWSVGVAKASGGSFGESSIYGNTIYKLTVGYFDYTPGLFLRPLLTMHISGENILFLPGITIGGSFGGLVD